MKITAVINFPDYVTTALMDTLEKDVIERVWMTRVNSATEMTAYVVFVRLGIMDLDVKMSVTLATAVISDASKKQDSVQVALMENGETTVKTTAFLQNASHAQWKPDSAYSVLRTYTVKGVTSRAARIV